MRKLLYIIITILVPILVMGQNFEVEGDAKINGRITDLTDPIDNQDAATKNYVDQMSEMMLNAGLFGFVEDIDGNIYKSIRVGNQVWMAENLKTTRYNDGTAIPVVTDNTAWYNLSTPGYCWYGNDSTMNAKLFGVLYNYYVVADTNSLNVCPAGWHVPSDSAWTILTDFLEGNGYGYDGTGNDIGKSMAATFRWSSDGSDGNIGNDQGTNNSSGWSGLPGGFRNVSGAFNGLGDNSLYWCSTENNNVAGTAWSRSMTFNSGIMGRLFSSMKYGISVRCIRD